MRYAFDIDNTLVSTKDGDYENSVPIASRISSVNKLYNDNHYIILYTARGSKSGKDYRELTEMQMKSFGVKYHELVMGKVDCDYFVDDKAITLKEFDSMMNAGRKSSGNYTSGSDSGYSFDDFKRFNALSDLEFGSVLDVGSGPCMLMRWLAERRMGSSYEAMDIRKEALAECGCVTHESMPARKKYDLVCLFGVSDYCNNNEDDKKSEFKELLLKSAKRSKDLLVFSLVKDSAKSNRLVRYSLEEIEELADHASLEIMGIDCDSEPSEYIVKCKVGGSIKKAISKKA